MACIFPSVMINDLRRAAAAGQQPVKREIRFPGKFLEAHLGPAPEPWMIGEVQVFPWCSSCGGEISAGEQCIVFLYDFWPDDGRTSVSKHYVHTGKCQHAGDGVDKGH